MKRNLIICGFMATGKTTVGRMIAGKLGMHFIDTDELIAHRIGKSIVRIFREDGQDFFRKEESKLIDELESAQNSVISIGGGMIIPVENYNRLRCFGLMVLLKASAMTIHERNAGVNTRPLLDRDISQIQNLLDDREKAYSRIENIVDTENLDLEDVCRRIITVFRSIK